MKQNRYDDPEFFARYSEMPRSVHGLDHAAEWYAFRSLLPDDLTGRRVLDLGCGFGWHCRYAREHGATSVLGIDISENMLTRARADTADPAVEYQCLPIEDAAFPPNSFDLVVSSLAFHYVGSIDHVFRNVHTCLSPGGMFVFSVEHPMFTARAEQDWHVDATGRRLHWPVDNYHNEGPRHTNWLAEDVVKYHRTIAAYVDTLIDAGFRLNRLLESQPSPEMIERNPGMVDELRRPLFLLISADRK